jgi:hypothetical protein
VAQKPAARGIIGCPRAADAIAHDSPIPALFAGFALAVRWRIRLRNETFDLVAARWPANQGVPVVQSARRHPFGRSLDVVSQLFVFTPAVPEGRPCERGWLVPRSLERPRASSEIAPRQQSKEYNPHDQRSKHEAPGRLTLEAFLADWLEHTVRPSRRDGTYLRYSTAVRLHVVPLIGKVPVTKLAPTHVQRVQAHLLSQGKVADFLTAAVATT